MFVSSKDLGLIQTPSDEDGAFALDTGAGVSLCAYTAAGEAAEILLFGAACDNIQNGDEHVVTATFACMIN